MVSVFKVNRTRISGGIPNAEQLKGLFNAIQRAPNNETKIRLLLTWKGQVSADYFDNLAVQSVFGMTSEEALVVLKNLAARGFGTFEEITLPIRSS